MLKTGLFRRDEGEAKIFADITGKEFSIAKKVSRNRNNQEVYADA